MENARKVRHGAIVADINPHQPGRGTVVDSRGGMYNHTLVQVFWHHLGYTNWENPDYLRVVES